MFHITDKKINIPELLECARHPEAGAIVIFSGETRNHSADRMSADHDATGMSEHYDEGKKVQYLEYEAQAEMAERSINNIISEAMHLWPLKSVIAVHRIGRVDISETAVVVITSAAHRKEAYEANEFIMNKIKAETPIWKKEFFVDGDPVWH